MIEKGKWLAGKMMITFIILMAAMLRLKIKKTFMALADNISACFLKDFSVIIVVTLSLFYQVQ